MIKDHCQRSGFLLCRILLYSIALTHSWLVTRDIQYMSLNYDAIFVLVASLQTRRIQNGSSKKLHERLLSKKQKVHWVYTQARIQNVFRSFTYGASFRFGMHPLYYCCTV